MLLLTWIAIRSPRYWPLFAAAFQLLCVIIHVARLIDPGVRAWSYATGQVIFSQMVVIAVGVGVWNSWRGNVPEDDPTSAAYDQSDSTGQLTHGLSPEILA